MHMETILLLRIFLWIPLCLILWMAAVIAAAVWGHNKTMARAKKAICLLICLVAVINTYFMFLHGKYAKSPLNPSECAALYDDLASLARSGEPAEGGGYSIERETENLQVQIFFDPASGTAPEPEPWDHLYGQSFEVDGVQMQMSALSANKEEMAFVQAFNGGYFGTLWMHKGDTELHVLYWVQQETANRMVFSYTCVPPKEEVSLSPLVS